MASSSPLEKTSKSSGGAPQRRELRSSRPTTTTNTPPFRAYPGYDPDPCYHAKAHDIADLCAQWRAAIASEQAAHEARRATNWSIAATILSFCGLLGVLWSLKQTEGALGEAQRGNEISMKANARATRQAVTAASDTRAALDTADRSANAAIKAADIAERNMIITQRAYIHVFDFNYYPWIELNGLHTGWHIVVGIKNDGRTRAEDVTFFVRHDILTTEDLRSFDFDFPNEAGEISVSIAPGGTVGSDFQTIKLSDLDLVTAGSHRIILWGRVSYRDLFIPDEVRTTLFAFEAKVIRNVRNIDTVPFAFMALGTNNTAS